MSEYHRYSLAGVGQSAGLFGRYVLDFPRVESFYACDYRAAHVLAAHAHRLTNRTWRSRFDRPALVKALETYAHGFEAPRAVLENIRKLRDPAAVCVVTGQQAGLGGGPLYVIYKAVTALRLADELERISGMPVTPVFWNASDDSDVEEVNRFRVFADGRLQRFRFDLPAGKTPVRDVLLPPGDDPQWRELEDLLPQGPHRNQALAWLREARGSDFGAAFTRLLLRLFGERGLVVIEPRALTGHPGWRRVLGLEIEQRDAHRISLSRAAEKLEALGLPAGVKVSSHLNLFRTVSGERRKIAVEGRRLAVEGAREAVSMTALRAQLRAKPAEFTPNVLLRPLVQNAIFPTAAYVGGPAEIAYHALLKTLHRSARVFFPALFPRLSLTLLEPGDAGRFQEALAFRSQVDWRRQEAEILFESADRAARESFAVLRGGLGGLARPLSGDVERLEKRTMRSIGDIKRQIETRPIEVMKDGERIAPVLERYFPENRQQERVLTVLGVWSRWGDALVCAADRAPDLFDFRHVAVEMPNGQTLHGERP